MQTKLTLRLDDAVIAQAKQEAKIRDTSVSRMVGGYLSSLKSSSFEEDLSPVTTSFIGVIEGLEGAEENYKRHLKEKHL